MKKIYILLIIIYFHTTNPLLPFGFWTKINSFQTYSFTANPFSLNFFFELSYSEANNSQFYFGCKKSLCLVFYRVVRDGEKILEDCVDSTIFLNHSDSLHILFYRWGSWKDHCHVDFLGPFPLSFKLNKTLEELEYPSDVGIFLSVLFIISGLIFLVNLSLVNRDKVFPYESSNFAIDKMNFFSDDSESIEYSETSNHMLENKKYETSV